MKENTRQKLIDVTFEEVFSNGYQGASLKEILEKAKVHKGSMYHYFKSKKEMALVAIEEKISNRNSKRYEDILKLESGFIDAFFDSLKDTTQRDFNRGCPIANVIQEMSNIDVDFNNMMNKIYTQFRLYIKRILDKAIQTNEIKACDTQKIALFIASTLEGAILSAKASGEIIDYLHTIEILENYIDTLRV
ncbi:MAG: TetR/AcrR family transcriptional regulator [Arcobacteraceae bacterium]